MTSWSPSLRMIRSPTTPETPSTSVGGQLASGASPGLPGASPQFPAEDVDAAPEAAAMGDSGAANPTRQPMNGVPR